MSTTTPQPATLGYDERRDQLEPWFDRNIIEAFNLQPCRMIDVCCGDGFWSMLFDQRGYTVVGIDRDADQLKTARARFNDRPATLGKPPAFVPLNVDDLEQLDALAAGVRAAGAPKLLFARTIPHFYQPTLQPAAVLLTRLLTIVCDYESTLLLSIYSDGSRREIGGATMHTLADVLSTIIDAGGRIADAQVVDGYMQIAVTRR